MNLLTYTPPTQRVSVIEHPASDAPCWNISTKEQRRLTKYQSAVRVQVDFPVGRPGAAESCHAFVVIDWSEDDAEEGVAMAARDCVKRHIDFLCRDLDFTP